MSSIEVKFHGMLTHAKTSKDMFAISKARYGQENGPRTYQLCKKIQLLNQGIMSVTEYFIKMQTLWDELQRYVPILVCGYEETTKVIVKQREEEQIYQFCWV